jgi:putative transposase
MGRTTRPIILTSENGLIFTCNRETNTVRCYGFTQEFITPAHQNKNGTMEWLVKSLNGECAWQHRFESLSQAQSVIASWIRHYNTERPHQALGYKPPVLFDEIQELSA